MDEVDEARSMVVRWMRCCEEAEEERDEARAGFAAAWAEVERLAKRERIFVDMISRLEVYIDIHAKEIGYEYAGQMRERLVILAMDLAVDNWKRDPEPDCDCEMFTEYISAGELADCDGDGHYMCKECARWSGATKDIAEAPDA